MDKGLYWQQAGNKIKLKGNPTNWYFSIGNSYTELSIVCKQNDSHKFISGNLKLSDSGQGWKFHRHH